MPIQTSRRLEKFKVNKYILQGKKKIPKKIQNRTKKKAQNQTSQFVLLECLEKGSVYISHLSFGFWVILKGYKAYF